VNGGHAVMRAALVALIVLCAAAASNGCGDNQITGFGWTPTPTASVRPTPTPSPAAG